MNPEQDPALRDRHRPPHAPELEGEEELGNAADESDHADVDRQQERPFP
jgi:hypothetical protein